MPSSKLTSQSNLSKCNITTGNSLQFAGDSAADDQLNRWPPTVATVDRSVLQLKAKDGDMDANWEKIILSFKQELDAEDEQLDLKPSDVVNCSRGDGIENRDGARVRVRAKFSVPLSRREMEKDFEDMGERRLPRKPKKRPKSVQNQLDTLFPGLWLTEINADLYRVSDTKKNCFLVYTSKNCQYCWPTLDVSCIVVFGKAKGKMVKDNFICFRKVFGHL